ncbi:MAG: glycosyltransferase family 4 protein [Limisphaerales bacterium]
MNLLQLTPGAGAMYCGNCLRDNALVAELRRQGHAVTMVPLYLPLTLDEENQSAGTPVFFGGISVYLDQKLPWFRAMPHFVRRLLASEGLLRRAAGRTAKTRAADVGDLMLSMLRGEEGNQARELDELLGWLKRQPHPDVVTLSNALLLGLARRLRSELATRIVCTLQGEDGFLDALPAPHRDEAWRLLRERAADVDLFIAPSRYFAGVMTRRLGLDPARVRVIPNGLNLEGYDQPRWTGGGGALVRDDGSAVARPPAPVLGYLGRMCREKGLDTLVEAFIELKRRDRVPRLKLHIGGGCGPGDEPFVKEQRKRLAAAGFIGETQFVPNLSRAEKIAFLQGLTVFSVPADCGEAFGLYVLEALAAGVPVVQPRVAAFPEILEATGGGVLCEPGSPKALADAIEELLLHPDRARALGEQARRAVRERFSVEAMADEVVRAYAGLVLGPSK